MSGATLAAQPQRLTLRRPDDWHVHLRDGALLRAVVGHTARQFARAIVMPADHHRRRCGRLPRADPHGPGGQRR